jgi:flagellar biosynthesis chaperone FliJ
MSVSSTIYQNLERSGQKNVIKETYEEVIAEVKSKVGKRPERPADLEPGEWTDQAVKVLEEKKLILEKAYEKLYEVTQERDGVARHRGAKLAQLREALDEGARSDKIQQMKVYLKVVDEDLQKKEKKVTDQQKEVDAAQKQVDLATEELFARKKDVEKLQTHKAEWQKEVHYLTEQKEATEHDELGSATYSQRKREVKIRKKRE